MSATTVYVLLALDLTPDPAPNEIWAFGGQAEAESFLRSWSEDFLGGHAHAVSDAELVAAFRAAGTSIHLYQCHLNGDSEKLVPFERESEAA